MYLHHYSIWWATLCNQWLTRDELLITMLDPLASWGEVLITQIMRETDADHEKQTRHDSFLLPTSPLTNCWKHFLTSKKFLTPLLGKESEKLGFTIGRNCRNILWCSFSNNSVVRVLFERSSLRLILIPFFHPDALPASEKFKMYQYSLPRIRYFLDKSANCWDL